MTRRKSISERLRRVSASKPELRAQILHEWADQWLSDHIALIDWLKNSIDHDDWVGIPRSLGQLRELTEMKHSALHNIIDELIYPSKVSLHPKTEKTNDER